MPGTKSGGPQVAIELTVFEFDGTDIKVQQGTHTMPQGFGGDPQSGQSSRDDLAISRNPYLSSSYLDGRSTFARIVSGLPSSRAHYRSDRAYL